MCRRAPLARANSRARRIASVSLTGGRLSQCARGSVRPASRSVATSVRMMSVFSAWTPTGQVDLADQAESLQQFVVGI